MAETQKKSSLKTVRILVVLVLIGMTAAFAVIILIPALPNDRIPARQIQCASQLKGISSAIVLHQNDHQGNNPAKLEDLIETADIQPSLLVCPLSDDDVGQCSYIYRGSDLNASADSNLILAHDKAQNHPGGSRNVLFADGHINRITQEYFQSALDKDNEIRRKMGLPEK